MTTIAAISTPLGYGGIGIIRISGDEAFSIVNKIFRSRSQIKPNHIVLGKIFDKNEILDDVLVSYFRAPKSYTGEDVIEINSHGGILVVQRILDLVLKNGAKLAEPGEFTKRAFLNGKMDLTQAEAVVDIINSKTQNENNIAAKQLNGKLGTKLKDIKNKIVDCLVDIEANVDYPEYDIEQVTYDKVAAVINSSKEELSFLSQSFNEGKIIKNGINTAIIGRPNVGKSSLLNALLEEERAIVTDIAGTTRDIIKESIILNGIVFNIIDTAGIRDTNDTVEQIGVDKSIKALEEAELVVLILNNNDELSDEDKRLIDLSKDKKKILVINKIDLEDKLDINQIIADNIVKISAKNNVGVNDLKEKMVNMFVNKEFSNDDSLIITNIRHKEAIDRCLKSLENISESINLSIPLDMLSIDLQNAVSSIDEILGENVSEDIINGIFKKFCLGK